ncbi:hypothetical protein D3C76_1078110 [compost metagenome]
MQAIKRQLIVQVVRDGVLQLLHQLIAQPITEHFELVKAGLADPVAHQGGVEIVEKRLEVLLVSSQDGLVGFLRARRLRYGVGQRLDL